MLQTNRSSVTTNSEIMALKRLLHDGCRMIQFYQTVTSFIFIQTFLFHINLTFPFYLSKKHDFSDQFLAFVRLETSSSTFRFENIYQCYTLKK